MYRILDSKGIAINILIPGEIISKFQRIIKFEKDQNKQRLYRWMFWIQIFILPLLIGGELLIMKFIN